MAFGESLAQDVGDEVQVAGAVYFGDDEGVEVFALEDLGEVLQGEAGGDAVDSDGLFADAGGAVAVQDCEDVGAGFGFFVYCDAVFEVVGYAVDGEGAGFFEEAH